MSKKAIETLVEERKKAWEEAKKILDDAETEGRSLEGETEEAFQKANTDIDSLDARIQSMLDHEERGRKAEEFRSRVDGLVRPEQERQNDPQAEIRDALNEQLRQVAKRQVDFAEHFRADNRVNANELRVLNKGTGSAGGNTVPTTFYDQLLTHLIEMATLLNGGARLFQTTSGESMDFPKTTGYTSAAQTAEAATISTSNPTFGKLTLGAWKYAALIDISRELIEDTAVDLLPFLSEEGGWSVGNAIGAKLITGAGTTEPSGIVTGATTGVTGGTGVVGVPTFDDLISLYHSVIPPYRNRPACSWLMKDSTVGAIRKLKDGQSRYLWEPSVHVGAPDTILGKPVRIDTNMPATGLNNKAVVFGDLSRYYVRLVNGIRFERSDEFQFNADVVTFRVVLRGDGGLADVTGAVKCFVGGAS